MDLPRRVHEDDRVRARFPKQAVAQLAFKHGLLGVTLACAVGRLAQLAFNGRSQAMQVPLHQVVMRAGLHAGHRDVFPDAA